MNIFVLDVNPEKCAQYHCDKHVIKMILESAQMICTVLNERGIITPYRSTHRNHPCVQWLREDDANIEWLYDLMYFLNLEYQYRFNKQVNHKSYDVIRDTLGRAISGGKSNIVLTSRRTPFKLCMPDYCRIAGDPVESYRRYYMFEKRHIATWTKRDQPYWWKEVSYE